MAGIGALIILLALVFVVASPWTWFLENIEKPINDALGNITGGICCEKNTVSPEIGMRCAFWLSKLAHNLPFCKVVILSHSMVFVARFDDGNFLSLIMWEYTQKDEAIVRKAVDAALARIGYIEAAFPGQGPIIALLRQFVYTKTMTVRDLTYQLTRQQQKASA